ncbi:MAG: phage tail tube protein [Nitrosotalea sp.]
MSYSPTLGLKVVQTAQYVEEATFGVFPTNPLMKWIGTDMQYSDSADMGSVKYRNLGSEDLKGVLPGEQKYEITLDYAIQNSVFAKYLVNSQGGGTGTIDESVSLLLEVPINSVNQFLQVLGARHDSGSIKWQLGKETRANVKLQAQSIPAYTSTSPIGTGSFASDPGTSPFMFTDPGAGGITIGGVAFDIQELTVNFNRNAQRVNVIGQGVSKYIVPSIRDITGDITIILESTANYADLLNSTGISIVAPLKTGTSVLTLSNAFFVKQGKSVQVKDIVYEKYSFVAETASLT